MGVDDDDNYDNDDDDEDSDLVDYIRYVDSNYPEDQSTISNPVVFQNNKTKS